MVEVAYASMPIVPQFGPEFQRQLQAGSSKAMLVAGQQGGSSFASGFKRTIKTAGLVGGIGAALGIADFTKDAVLLEAEYGRVMGQIRVATQAPAGQLERLDDLAIRLGKDTIFSASDASEAMLELAKNGIKPATIEAGALDSALTLAAAGGVNMEQAATTMGNALNAFQLKGGKSSKVAAALAGAANASSASISSLSQGLQQSAASANDAGLSVQETTAFLAAFANAGIDGSDAGTSLKTMLTRLVPSTRKAANEMRKYGLDFTDANGEFINGVGIARELREGLGDLSAEERSAALNTIFGSDARRAATILTREGAKGLKDYIKATSDQGAAEELAQANMEGTAGSIERLKGSWETTKLEFGKSIAPVAADFMDALAGKVDDVGPKLVQFGDFLSNDVRPKVKSFVDFIKGDGADGWDRFRERMGPLAEETMPAFAAAFGDIRDFAVDALPYVEDLIGAFNDLPEGVKKGLIIGGGALAANRLLRGRGNEGGIISGGRGTVTGAVRRGLVDRSGQIVADRLLARFQRPLPVFVVNEGFGGGGGGFLGGKKGLAGVGAMTVGSVAIAAAAGFTIGTLFADRYLVSTESERDANKAKLDKHAEGIPGVQPVANVFTGELAPSSSVRKGVITDYKVVRGLLNDVGTAAREARDKAIGLQTTLDKTPREVDRITASYEELEAVLKRLAEVSAGGIPNTPGEATPRGFGDGSGVFAGANVNLNVNTESELAAAGRNAKRKRARAGWD